MPKKKLGGKLFKAASSPVLFSYHMVARLPLALVKDIMLALIATGL